MNNIFPESNLIEVNGIRLEVYEAGLEHKGNPIVLCHGWPQHAYSWRYQIQTLVNEGYHVIMPNQRGYGQSSCPDQVTDYDIEHLTGDLIALLDHYNYKQAVFMGHDWGATVVWNLALLHPSRVKAIINLSVPYLERGQQPWVEFLSALMGPDHYMVHFNEKPGVADAILNQNTQRFLRNLFRKNEPKSLPKPGMLFIGLANEDNPLGELIMGEDDLNVFVTSFKSTGFTPSINWYRNLDRNWHILADIDPKIMQETLMIYGAQDPVMQFDRLSDYVPNVEVTTIDCGHWIQEEKPDEVNEVIAKWLRKQR